MPGLQRHQHKPGRRAPDKPLSPMWPRHMLQQECRLAKMLREAARVTRTRRKKLNGKTCLSGCGSEGTDWFYELEMEHFLFSTVCPVGSVFLLLFSC